MSNEQDSPKRLLTVADVADWLSVSGSLVYQLVESGALPIYRIGRGRGAIRFRPEDIEAYLDNCRTENCQPQSQRKLRPQLKHIRFD
jgi:excisionase family DNA binding protein